ncbi:MAG TPA: amidohydrolase [Salinimicrobium sp.]|nr:amidohydrolase [Salinimicrobium sp.]
MHEILNITLIQTELEWENPIENKNNFEKIINDLKSASDLIILPEMFTTGFSMNAEKCAEEPNGSTFLWMQKMARENSAAITGSIIVKENDLFYNRLYFVLPDGTFFTYNKRHTFTLAGEDKIYASGKERLVVNYKGWKICPLICYDLRFPVWSRNNEDFDLLIYVANWPQTRIKAWDVLLKARAIENMSYCAGINRIGLDENNIQYSGHSIVWDSMGNECSKPANSPNIIEAALSKTDLKNKRNKFRFLDDRDEFILK